MISDLPSFTDRPMFKFNYEFPLYFGITMFAIQGLGVVCIRCNIALLFKASIYLLFSDNLY